MTEAYKQLQEILTATGYRKRKLFEDIKSNDAQLAGLRSQYDVAVLTGDESSTEVIDTAINLATEIGIELARQVEVYSKDPKELGRITANIPKVKELAAQIHTDNANAIWDMQTQVDDKQDELKKLKARFLKTVTELGNIERESLALAREMEHTKIYVPGREGVYCAPVILNRIEARQEGSIYIQLKESDKAFGIPGA
jgi:hypothetical protein